MSLPVSYSFVYRTPAGETFDLDVISADGGRAENEIGAVNLVLPQSEYPSGFFQQDGEIYVNRKVGANDPYLLGGTFYFLDPKIRFETSSDGVDQIQLTASDPITLLSRRKIAYFGGTTYTDKAGTADDLIKDLVRENLGSLVFDPLRDLSERLTVSTDVSGGALVNAVDLQWGDLHQVINDLCEQSWTVSKLRVLYDFKSYNPGLLNFETYIDHMGANHSLSSNDFIIFSDANGTLSEGFYEEDFTDEHNYVYAGGRGYEERRSVQEAADYSRVYSSFWNRREFFAGEVNSTSPTKILAAAYAELAKGRPLVRQGGKIIQSDNYIFGVHFDYGDRVATEYKGRLMDARVAAYKFTYDQDNGEQMEIYADGEKYA